jgi:hypothetical protein
MTLMWHPFFTLTHLCSHLHVISQVPDPRPISLSEPDFTAYIRRNVTDASMLPRAIQSFPAVAEALSIGSRVEASKGAAQSELCQLAAVLTDSFKRVSALYRQRSDLQNQIASLQSHGVDRKTAKRDKLNAEAERAREQIGELQKQMRSGRIDVETFLVELGKLRRAEFIAKALAEEVPGIPV